MGYIQIRSAFHYDDYELTKTGKRFYWHNTTDDPGYIPPKTFKTVDCALYWARLWEYKYFRNTRKYFNMEYKNGRR